MNHDNDEGVIVVSGKPAELGPSTKSQPQYGPPNRLGQLKLVFAPSTCLLIAVLVGLFFGVTRYITVSENSQEQVSRFYMYFIHVEIMILVGFGFLMTFLRRFSYGAVSLNFFLSVLVFLEALLCVGVCQQVFWNAKEHKIEVDIALLIDGLFAAGSGMIAFGAMIGKTTPAQITWLLVLQVPVYALNQRLVIYTWKALDMGGTIVIHLYGAYYGLSASYWISRRQENYGISHPKNGSAYLNDIFSMVGTLFLFIYWPSFNGAMASLAQADALAGVASKAAVNSQFLCIVNTVLSLAGCVLSTFAASVLVNGKLNMVHVQNATLAGGVAMGAACTLKMTPGGCLVVGLASGLLSTVGYNYVTPFLDRTIGLGDTCGVHNLHGMPAVLGGVVAALASLGQDEEYLPQGARGKQFGYQLVAVFVTMAIAIAWGSLCGAVVAWVNPLKQRQLAVEEMFDDAAWWTEQMVESVAPETKGRKLATTGSFRSSSFKASGRAGSPTSSFKIMASPPSYGSNPALNSNGGLRPASPLSGRSAVVPIGDNNA